MSSTLDSYVNFTNWYNISLLVLCLVGLILNIAMLAIFFTKKQVRRSAYTTYMVQIAVTDTAVCLLWLVMAAMRLSQVRATEVRDDIKSEYANAELLSADDIEDPPSLFFEQRLVYAMYYFHYYNNIFLLAAMSVERSIAVMKSLRCQRYNFKRKMIYAVSGITWFLAFVCALPSFINPSLITDNEQTPYSNSSLGEPRLTSLTEKVFDCQKPLLHAEKERRTYVTDCCGVDVHDCVDFFLDYLSENNDTSKQILDEVSSESYPENVFNPALPSQYTESELNISESELKILESEFNYLSEDDNSYYDEHDLVENYKFLLVLLVEVLKLEVKNNDFVNMCDPRLSKEAKLYQVIVNLVIGFFIPYLAIVASNLFIAFVLRIRAKVRLVNDTTDEYKMSRKRMSNFFRQFSHGLSRSDAESYRKSSPVIRRVLKIGKAEKLIKPRSPNLDEGYVLLESESKQAPKAASVTVPFACSQAETSAIKSRDAKLRLTTQLRRTSGGSGSSAESFLTDMTSLHTSPSPGVRLSAPSFTQTQDGKVIMQRACSADSSGGSTSASSRPVSTRRWSSEVFKTGGTLDDGKKSLLDKKRRDDTNLTCREDDKFVSTLPSRGERFESTQELLDSQTRLSASKLSRHSHQLSDDKNRFRAYSAASRTSTGAGTSGTLRPTITHKHAVKQMRVSGIVLCFVVVFTICWLPQRIVTLFYVTEALIGREGHFCNTLTSVVRLISFFSVLLNPIVYTMTQREMRSMLRKFISRVCLCVQKKTPQTHIVRSPKDENGLTENRNLSGGVINHLTTEELSRQERHARNRERWSRLVQRLGRPNGTASGFSTHDKPSDGTIDEEREDEKGLSSKNPSSKTQSSSNSFKIVHVINGLDDYTEFKDLKNGHSNHSNGNTETIL